MRAAGETHRSHTIALSGTASPIDRHSGNPTVAEAIDAMNAVPTADGGPRVVVQHVGPVDGHEPADDPLDIPEFLRRVH